MAEHTIDNVPRCYNMQELPEVTAARAELLLKGVSDEAKARFTPLDIHLSHGLAYTTGSALGQTPPTAETCLSAFVVPNEKAGLTAGARAWSKHFHRSGGNKDGAWWGVPNGPVAELNERALELFWRVMNGATWRNLHWLPHQVLVYEVRVEEGYGMRWAKDMPDNGSNEWVLRGFVEPMMENGHELRWRH
jgi:hypothetical protein